MIKRFLCVCLILALTVSSAYGADKWKEGTDSSVVAGTDSPSDIDTLLESGAFNPLQRMLSTYVNGCTGTITSDTVYTVSAGEVACVNAAGVVRMRKNTATTTVTNTSSDVGGLDTGALAASTWYYIYAVADADATTFTAIMSASASAPTNGSALYYKLIGCALTDGTSDWLDMFWSGDGHDVTIMWDVPMNESAATSNSAWGGAIDCTTSIPSISTTGIFGLYSVDATEACGMWVKPNGEDWATGVENGVYGYNGVGGQRICATDSTQNVQVYTNGDDTTAALDVEGFIFSR